MFYKRLRTFLFIFFGVAIVILVYLSTINYKSKVVLGGKTFNVDVSDTYFTLKQGLSERPSLGSNEGMIFVFEKPDTYGFWMKDMLFSIDIIWMDENFVITHIEKSIPPESYPTIFYPSSPSLYVLEVPAGQANLLGIKVGDKVNFSK